ncbi:hypothetical protein KIH75_08195 [Bifidobacterium sp. 64T4]|uniref:hypothetical protein n=1 Tax=Bifidobacterium pongonis TaxID=2834432 RepID=UPI001C5A28FD|nr:hypothetical protein [Bifidobacterium pongonis]MBW3095309.1 hypothetical protein [Bifidobacterium pongonis]
MSGDTTNADADPQLDNAAVKKKRVKFAAAGVAVAVLLAGGGWAGWNVYESHRLEAARAACATASESLRVAMNEYNTLKNGRAADMAEVTAKQVEDAKTVTALAEALETQEPGTAACVADTRADYERQTSKVESNRAWYAKHKASLTKAVKAVEESRDAKTLADAVKLLKDSKGKVADEKTRTALDKAIKAKDATAVAKAVKAVDDSVKAKEKADAQARAKAAQAAADGSAGSAGSGYASSGYSGGYSTGSTGGYIGYTGGYSSGSTGGYSGGSSSTGGSGAAGTPSQSTGGSSSAPSQSTGSGSGDMPYIPPTQSCTANIDGGWCSTGGSGEMYY